MCEFPQLSPAASFPVVFFDGEREIDIGNISVHPSLGFKRFQTLISQKIGISTHQISTSLVRRKKARSSPDIRRKVPIDESSDFASIARERDCFVLAILKRSRRTRSRRRGAGLAVEVEQKKAASATMPGKTILKRNPADGNGAGNVPLGGIIPAKDGSRLWDYESQLRNIQMQRERYLHASAGDYSPCAAAASPGSYEGEILGWSRPETPCTAMASAMPVVCEECLEAEEEGRAPGFHGCVYDAVTVGFRSAVGPIQRPAKKHIEASA